MQGKNGRTIHGTNLIKNALKIILFGGPDDMFYNIKILH